MHRLILGLDRMTNPTKWLSVQGAVKYYAIDKVIHDFGDSFVIVRGGISRLTGRRSEIRACSIIMKGKPRSTRGLTAKEKALVREFARKELSPLEAEARRVRPKNLIVLGKERS